MLDHATLWIYRTRHERADIGLVDTLTVPAVEGLSSELSAHAQSKSSPFKVKCLSPHSTERVTVTAHSLCPEHAPNPPRGTVAASP